MRYVAIDFETYYDNTVTVSELGNWAYTHHPAWEPLVVSLAGEDFSWAGPIDQCPWDKLHDATLVAHNAGFDRAVLLRLIELGRAPEWLKNATWQCTASLSAYAANVRSLHDAALKLLGTAVQKTTRDELKGKRWVELENSPFYQEVIRYARRDAEVCYKLWATTHARWPDFEQRLSDQTYRSCEFGVHIDIEKLKQYMEAAQYAIDRIESSLPWVRDGLAPASPQGLAYACRDAGIPVPPIKTHDPEEYQRWVETYSPRCKWVARVSHWRQLTRFLRTLETIQNRLRPDNTIEFPLLYFGAHTGRWSGGGAKLNMQNLRKTPLYLRGDELCDGPGDGVLALDIRALFIPRPGKQFIIADLSQIEPRVLHWLCGNRDLLGMVASGVNLYEAFARKALGWSGGELKKENPRLYLLAKCQVLGLGYGCGAAKFATLARAMGLDLTDEEAISIVDKFRTANRAVVQLWQRLETGLRASVGGDYEVELPSGRVLRYEQVALASKMKRKPDGYMRPANVLVARVGLDTREFYGGLLCENLVQATARDVFAWHLLRLESLGRVLWHVHDEVILETDPDVSPADVVRVMSETPEWLPGCPLSAEAQIATCYRK